MFQNKSSRQRIYPPSNLDNLDKAIGQFPIMDSFPENIALQYTPSPFERLFKRCVEGCEGVPACPTCSPGTSCSQVPPTCNECQKTICIADAALPTTISNAKPAPSKGPNAGAIAGGVVGGVFAIGVLTYLVWRFCIKTKRQQYEQEDWIDEQEDQMGVEKDFTMRRDARASTHTVGSIASTVLTRASNIIQIAYIPGVTNRSAPSTPGLLVPPVPPIPIALSSNDGSTPRYQQEHFFMPGDLRDSTYSGMTDRTSYARTSVASTIYGKNAVVSPIPAQTVIRGKPTVVSVKPSGNGSGELTPPVPSVDYSKYGPGGPPSPAFSVGSTFLNSASLNSASAATQVRPNVVRVGSGPKKTPTSVPEDHQASRDSNAITIIDDTPTLDQGPFHDPPNRRQPSTNSLSAVIEEATRKQQGQASRETTPFGDEHEVEEG